MTTNCKNCNHNFDGNFCPMCGQTIHTHEINFKSIIHEIQHSLLHIDKGIIYTTRELFSRPGHTIREYLDGKRVKHFKPVAYILVLSTIYTLLTHIMNQSNYFEKFLKGITRGSNEKSKNSLNLLVELLKWLNEHYAYATLIFIPITSLASYFAFQKTKFNYFQHLILNAFVAGQKTVVLIATLPIIYIVNNTNFTNRIDEITFLLGILLTFWTYFQFFNLKKSYNTILLTFFSQVIAIILFIGLLLIIAKVSKILT